MTSDFEGLVVATGQVATVEYRGDTEQAAQGKPWCAVLRCPDGCTCEVSGQQSVVYGFPTAFDAIAFRDKMAADFAAGKHRANTGVRSVTVDHVRKTKP